MKRRSFLNTFLSLNLGVLIKGSPIADFPRQANNGALDKGSVSVDDNKISFYLESIADPLKILHISDTHLFMDDERGKVYSGYSQRMAGAYNSVKHFRTGEDTDPKRSFEESLDLAIENKVDLLAMTGDIFSFPSEAAIEWVLKKLESSAIPYLYIAGNHDWHYEGMQGSRKELRNIWTENRLKPLYQGNNPLMASYKVKGVNFIAIDNSTYEIEEEQLEFFRKNTGGKEAAVLMMHIPLYAPGRSTGYGCGHPDWGAKTDRSFEIERRERWPENGHTKTTMDFYKEVFACDKLVGIFAGHVHKQSIDIIKGVPQFVPSHNATGAFLEVNMLPLDRL